MIFFRRRRDGEKAGEGLRVEHPRYLGGEPIVLGVFSGKGGCGKSSIASSLCLLFSGLGYGCMLVDFDVVNATATSQLFSLDRESLDVDVNASVLHILGGEGEIAFIQPRRLSIPLYNNIDEGYDASKKLWVLPARLPRAENINLLNRIGKRKGDVEHYVRAIVEGASQLARGKRIKYVILDTPPMKPEGRASFSGYDEMISTAMAESSYILAISSYDVQAVQGLITLISGRYPYAMRKIDALVINMAPEDPGEMGEEIRVVARSWAGIERTAFIRYDSAWAQLASHISPIAYRLGGASKDLIRVAYQLGYISKKDMEKLGIPMIRQGTR